jgi:hypothetical protein
MEIFLVLVGCALLFYALNYIQQARLEDPNNEQVVYIADLPSLCLLSNGPVDAALVRQSQNIYRELGRFENVDAAFAEISKSLTRAKIDSVAILVNTPEKLKFVRAFHSHGGKAEGKKLGGAIIVRV